MYMVTVHLLLYKGFLNHLHNESMHDIKTYIIIQHWSSRI